MKTELAAVLFALAAACGTAHDHPKSRGPDTEYYEGVGQYLFHSTEGSQTRVTINHEEIPGFMDAMAMPYLVQDDALVKGLEPGQNIVFRVVAEADGFYFVDRIMPKSEGSR